MRKIVSIEYENLGYVPIKPSVMIRCHLIWNEHHTEVLVIPDENGEFLVPRAYKQSYLVLLIEGRKG